MSYPEYSSDVLLCRKIHQKYGKTFYFGTSLLSRPESDATCVLYAFFRFPDEYVDTEHVSEKEKAVQKLTKWKEAWEKCYRGEPFRAAESECRILRASKYVFLTYHIPFEYSLIFLAAMIQDTEKARYETYEEVEKYMYGSAGVVGLMMAHILSSSDAAFTSNPAYREEILQTAKALGEAFQMTNFLRDIGEDYEKRGRIYLPLSDLRAHGVTERDLGQCTISPEFIALMQFEIERTRALYQKAESGIEKLPFRGRVGTRLARILYARILHKIEMAGYDVFSSRIHLSFLEKVNVALASLFMRV